MAFINVFQPIEQIDIANAIEVNLSVDRLSLSLEESRNKIVVETGTLNSPFFMLKPSGQAGVNDDWILLGYKNSLVSGDISNSSVNSAISENPSNTRTALELGDCATQNAVDLPISTLQQNEFNKKANLSGGNTFTGNQLISGSLDVSTGALTLADNQIAQSKISGLTASLGAKATTTAAVSRQPANYLWSDNATANRGAYHRLDASAAVGGQPITFIAQFDVGPSYPTTTFFPFALQASTSSAVTNSDSLQFQWRSDGGLLIRYFKDVSNFISSSSPAGFQTQYFNTTDLILAVVFTDPNTTTPPKIYINGKDVSASFTNYQSGPSAPNWNPTSAVANTFWSGYAPMGSMRPTRLILGALTPTEIQGHAQNGRLPDWCAGTGSAVLAYAANFAEGTGVFSQVRVHNTAPVNGVSDGTTSKDNVLRVSATSHNDTHYTNGNFPLIIGTKYHASLTYYIPAGQSNVTRLMLTYSNLITEAAAITPILTTKGAWTTATFDFTAVDVRINFIMLRGTTGSDSVFVGVNSLTDDLVYIAAFTLSPIGPIITPAINPGDRYIADLGLNKIAGLLTPGVSIVGNNLEHDMPIRQTVVTVADSTARKDPATYTGLGIVPYVGMRVQETGKLVEYALNVLDVTSDASWFARVLQDPATGNIDARLKVLAGDTSTLDGINIAPHELVVNTQTKRIEVGNENDDGGRYDPLDNLPAPSVTIPSTLTLIADASNNLKGYGLTAIPDEWKKNESTLTGLSIGQGVTTIGVESFYGCLGLTGNLVIPNSVTTIGNFAFQNCSGLTGNLTIGDSVTIIGASAFRNCSGLTGDLTVPYSVTSIGWSAFRECSGLTNVNCYVAKTVLNVNSSLLSTGITTIHARASDGTWTAGSGQTIGGKAGITVIKDL